MAWEENLVSAIVNAGFAPPDQFGIGNRRRQWVAPRTLKILGISLPLKTVFVKPHELFAGLELAALGSESDEQLRRRICLRRFYDQLDLVSEG